MLKTIIRLLFIAALLWVPFWMFLNKALLMAYSRNYIHQIQTIGAMDFHLMIETAIRRNDDLLIYVYASNCLFCSYNTGKIIEAGLEWKRPNLSILALSVDPNIESLSTFLGGYWRETPFVPYLLRRGDHEGLVQYMRGWGMKFSLDQIPYATYRKAGHSFVRINQPILSKKELAAILTKR